MMVPRCGWCGVRIWPWTRSVVRGMFGLRHMSCHLEHNQSVRQIADLVDEAERAAS